MAYTTIEFYKNSYHGNSIPDDEVQNMLDKASRDVDILTRRSIYRKGGFNQLSDFEQLSVQLAVCAQADHSYLKTTLPGLSSYSIGDVSVSVSEFQCDYDNECIAYLGSTNLMNRGL